MASRAWARARSASPSACASSASAAKPEPHLLDAAAGRGRRSASARRSRVERSIALGRRARRGRRPAAPTSSVRPAATARMDAASGGALLATTTAARPGRDHGRERLRRRRLGPGGSAAVSTRPSGVSTRWPSSGASERPEGAVHALADLVHAGGSCDADALPVRAVVGAVVPDELLDPARGTARRRRPERARARAAPAPTAGRRP